MPRKTHQELEDDFSNYEKKFTSLERDGGIMGGFSRRRSNLRGCGYCCKQTLFVLSMLYLVAAGIVLILGMVAMGSKVIKL